MPEVGLELHSSPYKNWTPAETCGIRPSPDPSTTQSEAQSVDIVHTPKSPFSARMKRRSLPRAFRRHCPRADQASRLSDQQHTSTRPAKEDQPTLIVQGLGYLPRNRHLRGTASSHAALETGRFGATPTRNGRRSADQSVTAGAGGTPPARGLGVPAC